MNELITAKVNLSLVDKARLFRGTKGDYLDLVLIPTPNSEYGDWMIKQNTSKEEREKKVEMPILGNAKIMGGRTQQQSSNPRTQRAPAPPPDEDTPVPF